MQGVSKIIKGNAKGKTSSEVKIIGKKSRAVYQTKFGLIDPRKIANNKKKWNNDKTNLNTI